MYNFRCAIIQTESYGMLINYVKRESNDDILQIPYAVYFPSIFSISRRKLHKKGRYLKAVSSANVSEHFHHMSQ
jgi:hypothetical protein